MKHFNGENVLIQVQRIIQKNTWSWTCHPTLGGEIHDGYHTHFAIRAARPELYEDESPPLRGWARRFDGTKLEIGCYPGASPDWEAIAQFVVGRIGWKILSLAVTRSVITDQETCFVVIQ